MTDNLTTKTEELLVQLRCEYEDALNDLDHIQIDGNDEQIVDAKAVVRERWDRYQILLNGLGRTR